MERPASPTSQLIQRVIHLAWPVLVVQTGGGCAALNGRVVAKPPGTTGLPLAGISTLPADRAACDDGECGDRSRDGGREIHQGVWMSLVLALVAICLNGVNRR